MRPKVDVLLAKLRDGSFLSSVVILAGGTGLGQLVVVLATPIITRLYDPTDFGVLTVFISVLSLFLVVSALRYEVAIPLPKESSSAINLVALGVIVVTGVSIVVAIVVFFFGERVAQILSSPQLASYLWLFPLAVFAGGIYQVLVYWNIRNKKFKLLTQATIAKGASMVGGQVSMGILQVGAVGLVGGYVLGPVMAGLVLARQMFNRNSVPPSSFSWNGIKVVASRYRRFPLISSWSALINNGGLQLAPLLLATLYGVQVAGWFGLSQRVAAIPITLIGYSVSQVYLGEASRLMNDNPAALRKLYLRTASKLFLYVGLPMVFAGLLAPWFFGFIFGEQWTVSGLYIVALLPMFLGQLIVVPLSQSLNILERQDLQLLWDIGRLLAVIFGIGVANYVLHLEVLATLVLYGCVMFVMYSILFIVMWWQIDHRAKVSLDWEVI